MTDSTTVRTVVILLGLIALAAIGAATYLSDGGSDGSPAWTLAGTAAGAIGALLVSSNTRPDPAMQQAVDAATVAGAATNQAEGLERLIVEAAEEPEVMPGSFTP
jgi:hypothetical protein